jgi:hypothetical protein
MTTTEEQNQVCFHTNTAIDPLSWEIIGMSAKDDESTAIGQFGSGLKFAIAILLRTGHQIYIIAEGKRYDFATVTKTVRGKQFEVVTCNGDQLGITTDMGKHWDLWMAYRELVSNTIDEHGLHFSGGPMEQGSSIVVVGDDFHKLLSHHDNYFVGEREPLVETPSVNLFRGHGTIFYRGVKVGEVKGAAYSYELKNHLDLTEDRTIKYDYRVKQDVAQAFVKELEDKVLLRRILTMKKDTWEHDLDYDWTWSPTMEEVVKDLWENAPTMLNSKVAALVRSRMPEAGWETSEPNEDQQLMLDAAKDFLAKAGYVVDAEIVMVINQDSSNMGFVQNGLIHLTEKAFEKGLFYLTSTLMEEYFHTQGFRDESRRFEEHLMEQILVHAKKHLKIVL